MPQTSALGRWFFPIILVVVVLKMVFAATLPLTGDEAYFDLWAQRPALGYYDHPPLTGLWLSIFQGAHPLVLRAAAIVASLLPALIVYLTFRRLDETRARLASLIALAVPLFMVAVLITTDTLMVLFGVLAIWLCQRAIVTTNRVYFLACGVFLGLAFLSKYFAGLLAFALLVHVALTVRPVMVPLVLIMLGGLPAIVLNIVWNWCNCWYNVTFNFVSRQGDSGAFGANLPTFLGMALYLLTPWVIWALWRHRSAVVAGIRRHRLGVWVTASALPLGLFLIASLFRSIGLHWFALFIPGLIVAVAFVPVATLYRLATASLVFAALHWVVVFGLLSIPVSQLANHRTTERALLYRQPQGVAELFRQYPDTTALFTLSYSRSAVLEYYSGRHFGVFGTGSRYGRQDDMISDFVALDGADFAILLGNEADTEAVAGFFARGTLRRADFQGQTTMIFEGEGFVYSTYRQSVLTAIRDAYYRIPGWLPQPRCDFLERYQL